MVLRTMQTQVAIIGGGPAGLMLSLLLHRVGIDSVVIEQRSRDHVLSRIRAGVLESNSVELLRDAGLAQRLDREGQTHNGTVLARDQQQIRIDFQRGANRPVMVYGQTELTRDLYDARDALGLKGYFHAQNVTITGADGARPSVSWTGPSSEDEPTAVASQSIECQQIAGCDGFHGVSRQAIPSSVRRVYERVYPFSWMGVLSRTPPVHAELVYSSSLRGFALCSMRSQSLSRYYIQCDARDSPENWSDDAFWDELRRRIPDEFSDSLVTGPTVEKSVAPLRSFVHEPMSWGNLYLCGDAAHIVPPTGAKGLNLALADVHYLANALDRHYNDNDSQSLAAFSGTALKRVWQTTRFSWWMTRLLHRFPDQDAFDRRLQSAEFDLFVENERARSLFAERYTGQNL